MFMHCAPIRVGDVLDYSDWVVVAQASHKRSELLRAFVPQFSAAFEIADSQIQKCDVLGQNAGLALQLCQLRAVLKAHEEENRDTDEEYEVERDLDSHYGCGPDKRGRKDPCDQGETACNNPPNCVSFAKLPAPKELDYDDERQDRRQNSEDVANSCHC